MSIVSNKLYAGNYQFAIDIYDMWYQYEHGTTGGRNYQPEVYIWDFRIDIDQMGFYTVSVHYKHRTTFTEGSQFYRSGYFSGGGAITWVNDSYSLSCNWSGSHLSKIFTGSSENSPLCFIPLNPVGMVNAGYDAYWPERLILLDTSTANHANECNNLKGFWIDSGSLQLTYLGWGDCMPSLPSEPPESEDTLSKCMDGIDNDQDGNIDWADTDCQNLYENTLTKCTDTIDNDGDGLVDWDDPDCQFLSEDTFEECIDGIDNDGDGFADMQDEGCADYREDTYHKCRDEIDNDGDNLTDVDDPDCAEFYQLNEICGNGVDDDGDGLIDYDDPDCSGIGGNEICDNGIDDDNDGLIDNFDPDCDNQQGGSGTGTVSNGAGSGTTKMVAEDGDPVPYGTDLSDVQYDDSVPDKGQVVEEDWEWLDLLFTSIGSHPIINVIKGCELTTSGEVSTLYVSLWDKNVEFQFDWLAQYLDYFGYFIILGANIYAFYILYFRG